MVEWKISDGLVDYQDAVEFMKKRAADVVSGDAPECIWLLEHPPIYTAGPSAQVSDLMDPDRFPVHKTNRGGQYTYHGPGQRVVYLMLDVGRRGKDLRRFVDELEDWVKKSLAHFDVIGQRRPGRVGIWVERKGTTGTAQIQSAEDKIAAIGVRLRHWVSTHGISINVSPDLEHFSGIVPCGVSEFGVTSLQDLGKPVSMAELDAVLKTYFGQCVTPYNEA